MSPSRRLLRKRPIRVEPPENAPAPARSLALEIILKVMKPEGPGIDGLLEEARAGGLYRNDDLALAREISMGVCRQRLWLEEILGRYLHHPLPGGAFRVHEALLVGIYQAAFLDRIPAHTIVDETVRLVGSVRTEKAYRGLANAIMRKVVTAGREALLPGPEVNWLVRHGVPDWLASEAGQVLPQGELEDFFAACGEHAPLNLRRVGRAPAPAMDALEERLRGELVDQLGRVVDIRRGRIFPDFLLIDTAGVAPERLPSFQAGLLTAEDEGAAMAGALAGARAGMRILDYCASPGGKTAQLADMAERAPVRFVATDVSREKLKRLRGTLARLDLDTLVETKLAAELELAEEMAFDLVLVDAPCSGLGTLRRHPEVRWRRSSGQFRRLARNQREILHRAAGLVAPGGVLCYSVCTFNNAESDAMADWFLSKFPGFRPEEAPEGLPVETTAYRTAPGRWRTFTHRHGCDSFFVARFRKAG